MVHPAGFDQLFLTPSLYAAILLPSVPVYRILFTSRAPYKIGDKYDEKDIAYSILLTPSANRTKLWTCKHSENQGGQTTILPCIAGTSKKL